MNLTDAPAAQRAAAPARQTRVFEGLTKIYRHMPPICRRRFYAVLVLMVLGAFAELATISSVLPFLSLLANPGSLDGLPWPATELARATKAIGAIPAPALLLGLFAGFAIIAGLLRLYLSRAIQRFGYQLGADLAVDIQRRILLQPYSFHIERNSAVLLASLAKVEVLVFEIVLPMTQAMAAAFLSLFIIATLIYIDPFTALVVAAAFSAVYGILSAAARKRLGQNSQVIGRAYDERMKVAQESLTGIRDVIIDNSHAIYLNEFERVNIELGAARANTAYIAGAPRFIIETVGMVMIAVVAVVVSQREGGLAQAVPVLGAVALGAQRLLPLLQQIFVGWSTAAGQQSLLGQLVDLLRLPQSGSHCEPKAIPPMPFRRAITIEKVAFRYPSRRTSALRQVSIDIPSGCSLAIVGETGSGKSTLADLLMGLIEPDEGRILIDGEPLNPANRRRWQRNIAHVPQSIFLADMSIAKNIAMGVPGETIDMDRVIEAARLAQLHEFVISLPDSYETVVGERGIRLSGGQRQRLGIARAIYKQVPVLVLDEATSALDEETEAAIIEALHRRGRGGRTMIIIAHRASTIAHCDLVARFAKGRLVSLENRARNARTARKY